MNPFAPTRETTQNPYATLSIQQVLSSPPEPLVNPLVALARIEEERLRHEAEVEEAKRKREEASQEREQWSRVAVIREREEEEAVGRSDETVDEETGNDGVPATFETAPAVGRRRNRSLTRLSLYVTLTFAIWECVMLILLVTRTKGMEIFTALTVAYGMWALAYLGFLVVEGRSSRLLVASNVTSMLGVLILMILPASIAFSFDIPHISLFRYINPAAFASVFIGHVMHSVALYPESKSVALSCAHVAIALGCAGGVYAYIVCSDARLVDVAYEYLACGGSAYIVGAVIMLIKA